MNRTVGNFSSTVLLLNSDVGFGEDRDVWTQRVIAAMKGTLRSDIGSESTSRRWSSVMRSENTHDLTFIRCNDSLQVTRLRYTHCFQVLSSMDLSLRGPAWSSGGRQWLALSRPEISRILGPRFEGFPKNSETCILKCQEWSSVGFHRLIT